MQQDHRQTFNQADQLFRQGRYQESLEILQRLNQQFPNQKNVLYPMALCFAHLGNTAQAGRIASFLATNFNDMRAQQLLQQLPPPSSPPPLPPQAEEVESMYSGLADLAPPPTPPTAQMRRSPSDRDWKPWLIGGAIVAVVALFVALPMLTGGGYDINENVYPQAGSAGVQPNPPAAPLYNLENPGPREYVIGFLLQFFAGLLFLYPALALLKKHQHDNFAYNLRDSAIAMFLIALFGLIPFVGWIGGFVVLMKMYDMGIIEVILLNIIMAALMFGLMLLLIPVLMAAV